MSISAVIITMNSAAHLPRVLKSVQGFDEILVCDMESTDNSVEIARNHGARVITYPRAGHITIAPARNFAIKSARSRWVLFLEDDETVSPTMKEKLYDYAHNDREVKGFYIPRKSYFVNRFNAAAYPDYQLRFFKKERTFWDDEINHSPQVDGKLEKIPATNHALAIHRLPLSLSEIIDKVNATTDSAAQSGKPQKTTVLKLMMLPRLAFMNTYFLKGAIRYGVAGYIAARHEATKVYYGLVKAHEATLNEDDFNN